MGKRQQIHTVIAYRFLLSLIFVFAGWMIRVPLSASAAQPFELHLLDVGQGQSVLIEAEGHYMLIDGGGRKSSSFVVSYLKQQGIDHLDLIALSHYDEDHMSGEIGVLSVFSVGTLLLPSYEADGELYQSFARAAISNGAQIQHPAFESEYQLGDASVEVVGPIRTDCLLENDRSMALRITYGELTCLICGDAEQTEEMDIVSSGEDMSADIYVANHHGSRTSSTDVFLDAVTPNYALISCGIENSYGHPAQETLQRLQARGIQMFRTDLQGTIVMYSDGNTCWFDQDPCQDWTPGKYKEVTRMIRESEAVSSIDNGSSENTSSGGYRYVCNTNTGKFHYPDCSSVAQMKDKNRINSSLSRDELIAQGYQPCGNCHP